MMTPERFSQLRFKHKTGASWVRNLTTEINECLNEIERLNKIILREVSENDELGSEFTYVIALKEENKKLREALK